MWHKRHISTRLAMVTGRDRSPTWDHTLGGNIVEKNINRKREI